jgi:hypothetical protein
MPGFLHEVNTDSRARVSLSPGSYGTGSQPGLKILQYIEKSSKLDKNGAQRNSFLVAATQPSREAKQAHARQPANGNNPLETPDYEGTAFFELTLHKMWLNWESVALAYNNAQTPDADGKVAVDYVAKSIASGDCTEDSVSNARAHYMQVAHDKVVVANTPAEQMDAAILTQYGKEMTQISIKIGTLMRLIDWKYGETQSQHRNEFASFDVRELVNTEFSGKVVAKEGRDTTEVDSVYSRK